MNRLAGYIIAYNEADKIAKAIGSLGRVCDSILVVDSFSEDATASIARDLGCEVLQNVFTGFASQRNFAVRALMAGHAPDFIVSIDADEWMDDDLVADIQRRIVGADVTADIFVMHRKVVFDGKVLRWGGYSDTALPRIFRPASARYEAREVNEYLAVDMGATLAHLRGSLYNDDVASWARHVSKHNLYSTLEAEARFNLVRDKHGTTTFKETLRRPYLRRRWVRERIWIRMPARPAVRFLQVYLVFGGFLDGRSGFRRALFSAWQEMCIDLKTEELATKARLE